MDLKKWFQSRGDFSRGVLTLMTGTILAQTIPFLTSPVLSRLYTPESFGLLALFNSLLLIACTFSSGRFEIVILLPSTDEEAYDIFSLVLLINSFVLLFLFLFILIFCQPISAWLGNQEIAAWLYVLPFSIFINGLNSAASYWVMRKKEFVSLAKARFCQTFFAAILQVLLFSYGGGGLIVAFICGQLFSMIVLFGNTIKLQKELGEKVKFSLSSAKNVAKRFKKFPLLQMPSTLIESFSSQMPVLLLGKYYDSDVVGFFSLSRRLVSIPIRVIGTSFGDVFRQKASADYTRQGDASSIFRKTFKWLLALSFFPFIFLMIWAPQFCSFVLGADWYEAGVYVQIMTPMFWLSFVVAPLSGMFMIAEKQEYDLFMQIALVLFSFISLTAGYYFYNSAKYSIGIFVFTYCSKYVIELVFSYSFCRKTNNMKGT